MNCKPGDLAMVISCPADQKLLGRLLTVTGACPVYKAHWDTDPPFYIRGYTQAMSFSDGSLRPIRDQPGEDETLTWAGHPEKQGVPA